MGTKNNPGKFDCYAKLEPDEPYFILRGKDPMGWLVVQVWVYLRKVSAHDDLPPAYVEKLNEAKVAADHMKAWALEKGALLPTGEWVRKALANFAYGKFGASFDLKKPSDES